MDIKDLNKSQLILLALLISFVTSLATGIATVSLFEQAPTEVVRPITKVVKETVEKVVRVEAPKQQTLTEEEIRSLIDKILAEKAAPPASTEPVEEAVPGETPTEPDGFKPAETPKTTGENSNSLPAAAAEATPAQ